MKIIKRFRLISKLINNQTNIAAKHFVVTKMELQKQQQKLIELQQIANEYRERITNKDLRMPAEQFKLYHDFIDHLDYVIKQQIDVVAMFNLDVEKNRKIWVQYHQQNKGLKDYIIDLNNQKLRDQLKSEQKELDTIVTDSFAYKKGVSD